MLVHQLSTQWLSVRWLGIAIALCALAASAHAQEVRSFHLPGGDLTSSLNELARQADIELVFDPSLTARRTVLPLAARLPVTDALQGIIDNWWRQGMMGGSKAHYDCIKVFSETDHTEDLKNITVPTLVMHSEDDQIVPFADSGPLAVKLIKKGTLKKYKDLPHGMPTTHAEIINADLLAFIRS